MRHVLFILICCIWGTSFILMKLGLTVFSPVAVGASRVTLAAMVVAVIWRLQRTRFWPFGLTDLPHLVFIGIFGSAVPFALQPYVMDVVERHAKHGSSFVGLMVALVPIMTIIASAFILRTRPTLRQIVGVVGGLIAMGALFKDELTRGVGVGDLALASITPSLYALCNTWIKRRFAGTATLPLLMCTMSTAAVVLIPTALALGPFAHKSGDVTAAAPLAPALAALLVLGLVCTGLATFMFYKLVQDEGPFFAGMVTYIIPCVAVLVGWVSGEVITNIQLGALVAVLAMVALVQVGPSRATPAAPPAPPSPAPE